MLLSFAAVLLFANASVSSSAEDAAAWIQKAEQKLYRWPQTAGEIRFEVDTDALAQGITAMEKDLARTPDANGARAVATLKRLKVRGHVDTSTGRVNLDIEFDDMTEDRRVQAMLGRVKSLIQSQVHGALDGLPLCNPSLLPKGAQLGDALAEGDSIRVHFRKPKDDTDSVLEIARASELPVSMTLAKMQLRYRYADVGGGRFLPQQVEVQPSTGPASRVVYTWQTVDALQFPDTVGLSQGSQSAELRFHDLHFERASK